MKPKIAIIANENEFGFRHHPATYVPTFYIQAISRVGGLPFILPLSNPHDAKEYVDSFDGFLLTGGQDVSPFLYGEDPMPKISATNLERDRFEINLVHEVQRADKPLMGICRGLQVINVALDGSLYQNLSYRKGTTIKHMQIPTDDHLPSHYVINEKPSFLKDIFGEKVLVNSLHNQGVKKIGEGLEVISRSTDGVVEAIRSTDKAHRINAVQWHPEMLAYTDDRNYQIFAHLIEQADAGMSKTVTEHHKVETLHPVHRKIS